MSSAAFMFMTSCGHAFSILISSCLNFSSEALSPDTFNETQHNCFSFGCFCQLKNPRWKSLQTCIWRVFPLHRWISLQWSCWMAACISCWTWAQGQSRSRQPKQRSMMVLGIMWTFREMDVQVSCAKLILSTSSWKLLLLWTHIVSLIKIIPEIWLVVLKLKTL